MNDVNETIELDHDVEGMEKVPNLPRDILEALNKKSEWTKPNIDEIEMINLANESETKRLVKIRVNFPKGMKDKLKEIFAWSYQDMPGLDIEIVVHRIPVNPKWPLVQQAFRWMKLKIILKIKEEVEK